MATTQITPDLSITRTEHPNATRLREGFAAFDRLDLETVRATMADDCVWINGGTSVLAGEYRGWDEISAMFGRLFEVTGGTQKIELRSVFADDARAVAVYDTTSTIAGETRTMRWVMVNDLTPEGLSSCTRLLAYDQAAADAHMSGIPQPR